jgi:CDP-diglyceride synthetase
VTNFVSRLLVAAVGLPLVLGMLWLGGWWLFVLVAVAAFVAVHEFVTTARPLRPLAPAVYGSVILALLGAKMGGITWLLGGFLTVFVLGFVLYALPARGRRRRLRSAPPSSGPRGSGSVSASSSCCVSCTRKAA